MAIVRIEEVQLFVSDVFGSPAENIQAEAFFERTGIPFTRIYFNHTEKAIEAINVLNMDYSEFNSDFVLLTKMPFLQYTEVHDDIPARLSPVKFIEGIDAIKAFPSFYNSIGN